MYCIVRVGGLGVCRSSTSRKKLRGNRMSLYALCGLPISLPLHIRDPARFGTIRMFLICTLADGKGVFGSASSILEPPSISKFSKTRRPSPQGVPSELQCKMLKRQPQCYSGYFFFTKPQSTCNHLKIKCQGRSFLVCVRVRLTSIIGLFSLRVTLLIT